MKTVVELLQHADPLADEGVWTAADRHAVRQVVLDQRPGEIRKPSRRRFTYGFIAAAAATLVTVIVASEWFRPGVIAAVRFEVRLAEDSPGLELQQAVVRHSGEQVYVHRQTVLTNSDIASAEPVQEASGSYDVAVRFTPDGATKLLQATRQHIGRRLAILVDGEVVIAPTVRSPIGTSAVISGGYTRDEAERVATGILGR